MLSKRENYIRNLSKIEKKLNKLIERGKDNYIFYFRYVNDIVNGANYVYFKDVLEQRFNIVFDDKLPINDIINYTWKELLKQNNGFVLNNIEAVYNANGVFQQSFGIYDDSTGLKIGEIYEIDVITTSDPNYLIEDYGLLERRGLRRKYLEVLKPTDEQSYLIDYVDTSISEERNLIERYRLAIEYLKN